MTSLCANMGTEGNVCPLYWGYTLSTHLKNKNELRGGEGMDSIVYLPFEISELSLSSPPFSTPQEADLCGLYKKPS